MFCTIFSLRDALPILEPDVVAADFNAVEPHGGRGGWTWYTGSAGWMYRLVLESLLGLRLEGDTLRLSPCIPAGWPGYRVRYRFPDTVYRIHVRQEAGQRAPPALPVSGVEQAGAAVPPVATLTEPAVGLSPT